MARVFTEGAETGNQLFWDVANGSFATNGVITTAPRSGLYHYYISTDGNWYGIKNFSGLSEFYFRMGIRKLVSGSGLVIFRNSTTNLLSITRNAALRLVNSIGGGVSSTTITNNKWYLLEVYYKIADSGGVIQIKIDGVIQPEMSVSGDTKPGSATTVDNFIIGSNANCYYDDIALNNTNGSVDNSWCGDGKIIALVPNGDSGTPQWIGSDGNNTNNYQLIDERPPSSSDYVRATGSAYTDVYNLSTVNLAGQTIQRIWVVSNAKSDTAGDYFLHGIKISGTSYLVTGSLPTSFNKIDIQSTGTWALNPYTGGAWSQEQIDNLLLVIKAPG